MHPPQKKSLSVIVSAFNEEKYLDKTIFSIQEAAKTMPDLELEILIINDGSTDNTKNIATNLSNQYDNLKLINNEVNIGLGASIRKGIKEAKFEKFIFLPGDNDVPLATLELLFINSYSADIVMTYFQNDEGRGRFRYLLSNLFKVIYTTFFDLYVIYINGPAIYPTAQLKKLQLISTRFSIVAEINVKLLRQGLTFIEIPSYRQVGMEGSTSASLKSLAEVLRTFLGLVNEVLLINRNQYAKRPRRIFTQAYPKT